MNLPEKVQGNLELIKALGAAEIAELINLRAGRNPESQVMASAILNQFNLIESELLEGKEATIRGDLNQVRDAVADIVLLAFGQQGIIKGLDLDTDYKNMCAYNMTRIPQSHEEAVRTAEKYDRLGIACEIHVVNIDRPDLGINQVFYPVRTVNEDQWDAAGVHYAPNKFLKSADFVDVVYEEIESVTIKVNPEDEKHVGSMFTKNMANKLLKEAEKTCGLYGSIPFPELKKLLDKMTGQRF